MLTAKKLKLHHLINAADVAAVLTDFTWLLPGAELFLLQADGRLFASAGAPNQEVVFSLAVPRLAEVLVAPGQQLPTTTGAYRAYPLLAAAEPVGLLVIYQPYPLTGDTETVAQTLARMLNRLLEQGLHKRGLADEALDRYRELNLLYRVAETISSSLDPQTLPHLMLEECRRVIAADVGLVYLADPAVTAPATEPLPTPSIAPALADLLIPPYHWRVGAHFGTAGQLLQAHASASPVLAEIGSTGRAIIATHLPSADQPELGGAVLCVPLTTPNGILGAIFLTRQSDSAIFTASDEKLLTALATQAAIALDNAQLHQKRLEQERLRREVELAYEVQASFIPQTLPQVSGWEFEGWWQPARTVSGDFYDCFYASELAAAASDATAPTLHWVGADVSGKGLPAALFMMLTRTLLRANAANSPAVAEQIQRTNQLICQEARAGMFVTLFYAHLQIATGQLTYVNAGHNPPFFCQARQQTITPLPRTGIFLGGDPNATYRQCTLHFQSGDWLLFYTDGVTEAVDPKGEPFGEERLLHLLQEQRHASASVLLQALKQNLRTFIGNTTIQDDITLLVIRRV